MATKRAPRRRRPGFLPKTKALRVKRAEIGVTVTRMAQDLGRNRCYLFRIFRGAENPSEAVARSIAEYFGARVEDLFTVVDLENPDGAAAA